MPENKISRICWNTEGWKFPSGSTGKSKLSKTYEGQYGFGHEEWLFDKSRIINGIHYAYIQPIARRHEGSKFNISLYTRTNSTNFFVGEIKNAICISKNEAEEIKKYYKQKGWLREMLRELEKAGIDSKILKKDFNFNIKFKFNNVHLPDELIEISNTDKNISTFRYKLLDKRTNFKFATIAETGTAHSGCKTKNLKKRIRQYKGETIFDPIHDKIQVSIYKLLRKKYKSVYENIYMESDRIDIKAKTHSKKWHYFEIKSNSPKLSIRNALGQLLEYSYWPGSMKAEKLIIVSHGVPDSNTTKYLNWLRKNFKIPIFYKVFNLENNSLSKDY